MGSNRKAQRVRTAAGHGFLDTNRIQGEGASFRRLSVWQSHLSRGLPTELQSCGTVRRYTCLSEGVPPPRSNCEVFFQNLSEGLGDVYPSYTNGEKERYVCRLSRVNGIHDGFDRKQQCVKMADVFGVEKIWSVKYEACRKHGASRCWEVPSQPV